MKKTIITILSAATFLSACVTNDYLEDTMNNNFAGVSTVPTPRNIEGTWTGSMGPWLTTFRINANGEGLYCYSSPTKDGIQKIKFLDNQFLIQDGSRFNLNEIDEDQIQLQAPYAGVSAHSLYRDPSLTNASLYCQKNL